MRPEKRIARIAARQCGVVTRRQLLDAGFQDAAIKRRIRAERLHPIHRGVYVVGHRVLAAGAREMAAVLACGRGAVVSHRSAATLHQLLPHPARPGPVHVSVVERDCGRRPGITAHRVKHLPAHDVGTIRGIPVTSSMRTILDLAATGSGEMEQAIAEAARRRLVRPAALLERARSRPGAVSLRKLLERDGGPAFTRSEAEREFLRLIRTAALPSPATNARLHGYEVDFLWRKQRLVVEVDGFAFHSSRAAFERDRARDAELAAAGYVVVRITWRRLVDRPEAVVARIAGALATR